MKWQLTLYSTKDRTVTVSEDKSFESVDSYELERKVKSDPLILTLKYFQVPG